MSSFSSRNPSPTRDHTRITYDGSGASSLIHAFEFHHSNPSSESARPNATDSSTYSSPTLPSFPFHNTQDAVRSVSEYHTMDSSSEISRIFKKIASSANAAGDAALSGHPFSEQVMEIQASLSALTALLTTNGFNHNDLQSLHHHLPNHESHTYLNPFPYDGPVPFEQLPGETAEMSRKRCASSVAGPPVNKTMKIEPESSNDYLNGHTNNISDEHHPELAFIDTSLHRSVPESNWNSPTQPLYTPHHSHSTSLSSIDSIDMPHYDNQPMVFTGSSEFKGISTSASTIESGYPSGTSTPPDQQRGRTSNLHDFHHTGSDSLTSALDSMNFQISQVLSPTSPDLDHVDFQYDESDPAEEYESDHQLGHRRSPSRGDDLSTTHKETLERVILEFLNKLCSNLEAKDNKGELIHQPLMAKKMQRLDEFPDFRPFKFRIAAFTNAFIEELHSQGWSDIPVKKARVFLWNSPLICRYTDEGRKSKSKGNHVWTIDAKKSEDGLSWSFRPFPRKIVGIPEVPRVGSLWRFGPRIWDPQNGRPGAAVQFSSPSLPPWLSWTDDVLTGVPPIQTEKLEFTVEAKFRINEKDCVLSESFALPVTSATKTEPSSPLLPKRSDPTLTFHRTVSDSIVPLGVSPRKSLPSIQQQMTVLAGSANPDIQVVQVLQSAARRVAQLQQRLPASTDGDAPEMRSFLQQKRLFTVAAQLLEQKPIKSDTPESPLAAAARSVVLQAAIQAKVDRQVVLGIPSSSISPEVTVNDVTAKIQSIIAEAVEIHLSNADTSDVEVLQTARSLISKQSHTAASNSFLNQPFITPGM